MVAVIAGGQSGKTLIGPAWLIDRMQECGEGDYLIAAPDYPTLNKQAVPEFQSLFESILKLGKLTLSPLEFKFGAEGLAWLGWQAGRRPPRVLFGHTTKPSTMEAMGVKAAWIDEAGMAGFRLSAWEDLQQRLAISQGRILLTSKPYSLNWLKTHVYDRWKDGDPGYHVVQFGSAMNPAYPPEEIERAKGILPRWKFNMHYLGRFERPAGLIYDCFEKAAHTRPWAAVSPRWPRRLGIDFGAVNTCGVFLADEIGGDGTPSGRMVAYREHRPGQRLTPEEHVLAVLQGEPGLPDAWGGSRSEDGWRERFCMAGLPVREPPNVGVEAGIDAVYSLIKQGKLLVMDNCVGLLDELASYSREVDGDGEPTEKIEDANAYHYLDALRYILCGITGGGAAFDARDDRAAMITSSPPAGVFFEPAPGGMAGYDFGRD